MTAETTAGAARDVNEIEPIGFATDAREVALGAYERLLGLLERLDPDDWDRPTECPGWSVADMVGHIIGAAKSAASLRETVRQQRWGSKHAADYAGNSMDATNDLQVRDHAQLTPAERIAELRRLEPRAVAGRTGLVARLTKGIRLPMPQGGSVADGMPTSLTLGHLNAVILTRDVWMHAVDIARATDRTLDITAALDGRIVADVVAEWARRHGQPFVLNLSGPAGGRYRQGQGGVHLEHSALEFCRIVSGRAPGEGLLATLILF
jgi:uncharacterized protein (TIGR03083 family)